jgi:hypothetical protein
MNLNERSSGIFSKGNTPLMVLAIFRKGNSSIRGGRYFNNPKTLEVKISSMFSCSCESFPFTNASSILDHYPDRFKKKSSILAISLNQGSSYLVVISFCNIKSL